MPVQVPWTTGLLTVFFSARPVRRFADAQACDLDAYARFCRGLLDRGVYAPASQFEAWFPSLAHSELDVERTVMPPRGRRFADERPARADRSPSTPRSRCTRSRTPRPVPTSAGSATNAGHSSSRRSRRPSSSITGVRGRSARWTPTCACSPATRSTRWRSNRLAERGDLAAIAELAELISLSARAVAERRAELLESLWEASAGALDGAGPASGARALAERAGFYRGRS